MLKPVFSLQDVGARRAPADWGRPFAAHAALQAGQHLQPSGPYEPVRYLGGGPLLAQLCAEVCAGEMVGLSVTYRFLVGWAGCCEWEVTQSVCLHWGIANTQTPTSAYLGRLIALVAVVVLTNW